MAAGRRPAAVREEPEAPEAAHIDNKQNRNTFCHIWKWARRERKVYDNQEIPAMSAKRFPECSKSARGMARHKPRRR